MKLMPVLFLCVFTVLFWQCKQTHQVDVSNIEVKLQSVRFDEAFSAIDTNNLKTSVFKLAAKYPDFTSLYTEQLQGWGSIQDSNEAVWNAIKHFLTYKDYVGLQDSIRHYYPDTKKIDEALEDMFKHYKYYYPQAKVPRIYYFNSGLNNWGSVTLDDTIAGVGLDMYLGEQYPFYASVQIPQYKWRQLSQKNIAIDLARNLYRNLYSFNPDGKKLLELMLDKGKEQYFIDAMLPEKEAYLKFGYTKEQLEWCEKNEYSIYSFFLSNKLLYNNDMQQIFKFVTDGPNTMGMPNASPGNIGAWLGYRIVKAYMENNTQVNLQQLMQQQISVEQFLQKSKYKP